MTSKGTLHKIDDFYYQCGGITNNHIKEVSNLDGYEIGSSLNDWGCHNYNPSLQVINLKTQYKNGIVDYMYVVEPIVSTSLKQYKFYLDISDELADRYRNKYITHRRYTSRNWGTQHVIKDVDLLCFGENNPDNYSPYMNPGPNWLFDPVRDEYVKDNDNTDWEQANNDFYENKFPQLSQYFSGPKIAKDIKVTATRSCGTYNSKGTPCQHSILGKDNKFSDFKEGMGWSNLNKNGSYFTNDFGNKYNYNCKGYGNNCMWGKNNTNAVDWFTRYTYPCLTPRAYINPPQFNNNVWQAPAANSDSIYYRGPNNEFNVVLKTIFRRLKSDTPNPPEITTDQNTLILFTVTYNVDWSNPDINGYKLLDLLDFVSLFDNGLSTKVKNNKTVRENNSRVAKDMVQDFCNTKGEMENPICSPETDLNNYSLIPSIISDDSPCGNYEPCKKGWNMYCNNPTTYNNQNCIGFYNNIVENTSGRTVDPELETTLTEVCSNMYNNGNEDIDLNVCGCFLKDTRVYDDIKEKAKLPNFLDFGTPKCWYGPCVSSPYHNHAGTCTDVTYTQCIQNSYANIQAGGNVSKSENSVTQVINSCGPSTENDSDELPEPEPVPEDKEEEQKQEQEEEKLDNVNSISNFVKKNIVIVILIFAFIVIGGIFLGIN